MKLKIKVTKEILQKSMMCATGGSGENAIVEITKNCAISLACQEIFPNCETGLRVLMINKNVMIDLPIKAQIFITQFDALYKSPEKRLDLQELEFEVELTKEVLNLIDISEVKEILKESKTLELIENV